MNTDHKRGIRIQTRIIVSAILLLLQILLICYVLYDITAKSVWTYAISMVAGIVTVIYIVNSKGNPSYKITWIIFILVFPIFGVTVFLLWGGGRMLPYLKRKMTNAESRTFKSFDDDSSVREKLKFYDLIHARQADYLTSESEYPLYEGTSTEYLAPGEKFLPRFIEELKLAEKYIFIEFFILAEGQMWELVHNILSEKVKKGIEVKILFDDFGSIKRQHRDFLVNLEKEGIGVSVFNPIKPSLNIFMNNRNHRKIVVIDGKTAITGGLNIGDEYINKMERFGNWMDCAVILKGKAVKSFLIMFCNMWEFTTKIQIDISSHVENYSVENDGFVLPYCDGPLNDRNPAEGIYMQILNTAQKYVYIVSPYLIIDNTMMSTLKMAARSGIDVRILTPHVPDKWYVHPVTQYNYKELLESGVRIYEYTPGFIHSKLFVSDDMITTIGTINMDYRSFVFHFECGAWICNSKTVFDVKEHFKHLISVSEEIDLKEWNKRPVFIKIKQSILHLFAPFM